MTAAFAELMSRLGYERYGVQGGDRGGIIARELGRTRPGLVIGVHANLLPGVSAPREPDGEELAGLSASERERTLASWRRNEQWSREQDGYAAIQSTRPQTLAYGLTDSPVGQLAPPRGGHGSRPGNGLRTGPRRPSGGRRRRPRCCRTRW